MLPLAFSNAEPFCDGLAMVAFAPGDWGYIDENGKLVWGSLRSPGFYKLEADANTDIIKKLLLARKGAKLVLQLGKSTKEAIPILEMGISEAKKALGEDHPQVLLALNELGNMYVADQQNQKAVGVYLGIIRSYEKKGKQREHEAVVALSSLGVAYDKLGQFDKALPCHERCVNLIKAGFGADSVDFASALENLACHWSAKKEFARARPLLERVVAIEEKHYGKESVELFDSLLSLGAVYHLLNISDKAIETTGRAVSLAEKKLGAESGPAQEARQQLAEFRKGASASSSK